MSGKYARSALRCCVGDDESRMQWNGRAFYLRAIVLFTVYVLLLFSLIFFLCSRFERSFLCSLRSVRVLWLHVCVCLRGGCMYLVSFMIKTFAFIRPFNGTFSFYIIFILLFWLEPLFGRHRYANRSRQFPAFSACLMREHFLKLLFVNAPPPNGDNI